MRVLFSVNPDIQKQTPQGDSFKRFMRRNSALRHFSIAPGNNENFPCSRLHRPTMLSRIAGGFDEHALRVLFSVNPDIQKQTPRGCLFLYGGDEENRTPDPLLARQVLSQLSYTPITKNYYN